MTFAVRLLDENSIPAYVDMLAAFHATCPVSELIPFDPEGTAAFLRSAIENGNFLAVYAEVDGEPVGVASAAIYPMYFNPNELAAQEMWWWINPAHRGGGAARGMFKTLENWAKTNGATALFMVALHDSNVDRMGKLYARSGYKPMERTFVKGLL